LSRSPPRAPGRTEGGGLRSRAAGYRLKGRRRAGSALGDETPGTATLLKDYVYLGKLLVATNTTSGSTPLGWVYYSSDHLGSPRILTDPSHNTLASYRYRSFGLPMNTSQTPSQGPDFASMEKDASTGHHFDHARFYGNWISRFNSPDKLGGKVRDPQSWNRYAYTRNNPLKYVDPDGQQVAVANTFRIMTDPSARAAAQFFASASAGAEAGLRGGAFALTAEAALAAGVYGGPAVWRMLGPAAAPLLQKAATSPQAQEVENALSQLSNNSVKHITAHLGEFQKLDPNFALKDAVKLGVEISSKAENLVGTPGGRKVFEQVVTVGEQNVLVRVVLNTEEKLRSVFIRATEDLLK
jgi:RHS repeat-associated protein